MSCNRTCVCVTTPLPRPLVGCYQKNSLSDGWAMVRIRDRQDRHFMDERGRMFWINGPEEFCYLSEQRQWRKNLSFAQVLEWKQCAPSGLVSQRFTSIVEACEAFEHNRVVWSRDLYLRRMGDQMALHRSVDDYRPTSMKLAEAAEASPRVAPWLGTAKPKDLEAESAAPSCQWPGSGNLALLERPLRNSELLHPHRRRRSRVMESAH